MTEATSVAEPWQRLDKRMLLVHPVTEVVKFIPVLVGSVILGTNTGNHVWSVIPLALIIGFALTRWFTTTYRVGPTHVELRTGLIQRKKLSVPRTRIRSVDIEADLLHRMLGLAVLAIGTGQQADKGEQFKLDALDAGVVPALRATLLAHTGAMSDAGAPAGIGAGADIIAGQEISSTADRLRKTVPEHESGRPAAAREIGNWRPSWVRYAPLSLTGFAIIAPVVGVAFQYGIGEVLFRSDTVHSIEDGGAIFLAAAIAALVLAIVVVVSLASCARYLTTYFGLRVLDDGHTLQLRHGLFTTRQITLDLARFRGATVNEPLLLRLAGAAELEAVMVGENPRQKILPQAPRAAIEHTLAELLAPRAARYAGSATAADAAAPTGVPLITAPSATPPSDADTVTARSAAWPTATAPASESKDEASQGDQPGFDEGAAPRAAALSDIQPAPTQSAATAPASQAVRPGFEGAAPSTAPLIAHGPVARRRRYTRALVPVLIIALIIALISVAWVDVPFWWWLLPTLLGVIAVALAEDRYRGLGHAVLPKTDTAPAWLITRAGSLDRDRDCLEAPGVIGWTVRQSLFQRRAGVATVIAATAAGKKRYRVIDIPIEQAWPLIEGVTPGQLGSR